MLTWLLATVALGTGPRGIFLESDLILLLHKLVKKHKNVKLYDCFFQYTLQPFCLITKCYKTTVLNAVIFVSLMLHMTNRAVQTVICEIESIMNQTVPLGNRTKYRIFFKLFLNNDQSFLPCITVFTFQYSQHLQVCRFRQKLKNKRSEKIEACFMKSTSGT